MACALSVLPGRQVSAQDAAAEAQARADEEARVHFRLGVAYHDSGRFAEAAGEFAQAYELSKRPKLLYNLFLAYRDGGNIAAAADALERYLSLEQDVPERDKLTARLEALQRILAENPSARAEPAPAAQEQEPKAAPEPLDAAQPASPVAAGTERNPWHKYAPWVTMGTGVALAGVGAGLGAVALSDYKTCESDGCTADALSSGQTKARAADAMLFGGVAVAATGVVLYFVLPRERQVKTVAGFACAPGACAASVRHRF